MLLPAHTDRTHVLLPVAELRHAVAHRLVHGIQPHLRVLLHVPGGQPLDHSISAGGKGKDLARFQVQRDRLCALRAAIDTEGDHGEDWKFSV